MDDEKEKKETERKEAEEAKAREETEATEAEKTRVEDDKIVEAAKAIKEENEKKEKLLEREEKLQDRKEALQSLGGGSPAGTKPAAPTKLTDTEYAEALERGEVNPLKEDGLI